MENPTRYDLNAAIESWRQELLAQPNLTLGDRRELETHLRDTIAELRKRGIEEEESFVLAWHRVSPPALVDPEFADASPATIWRERVLWAAVAFLIVIVWQWVIGEVFANVLGPFILRPLLRGYQLWLIWYFVTLGFQLLPLFYLAVMVSNGRIPQKRKWMDEVFNSRSRFIFVATGMVLSLLLLQAVATFPNLGVAIYYAAHGHANVFQLRILNEVLNIFLLNMPRELAVIALIAWLIPNQKRAARKFAGALSATRQKTAESQASFDINTAIETWRRELLAQPHLTPGDLRELETHLRDTFAALRERCMDEEESFVLARHRVGNPRLIVSEFVKADPSLVWRMRALWAAVAFLIVMVWGMLAVFIEDAIYAQISEPLQTQFSSLWILLTGIFSFLPPLCLAVILCNRQIPPNSKWIEAAFASRWRFILAAAATVCSLFILETAMRTPYLLAYAATRRHVPLLIANFVLPGFMFYVAPSLALIALIAWLMPARQRKTA